MLEYYKLYLPKSKREVKIEISVSRYRENITFDTLYMLDGQNAFKDSHASFGRAIRANKALGFAAKEMGRRILGVAIHNSGSDEGRIAEYSPFKIDNPASDAWAKHDPKNCYNFCEDLINTIIPFVESKYNVYKNKEHRFIYGSSLAANTALYLAFKYKDAFSVIGAFSTASFLYNDSFNNYLKKNIDSSKSIFLYVGKRESSDNMYDQTLYYNTSMNLYNFFKANNNRVKLVVSASGIHNEETWGNHLLEFISFIYSSNIEYKE